MTTTFDDLIDKIGDDTVDAVQDLGATLIVIRYDEYLRRAHIEVCFPEHADDDTRDATIDRLIGIENQYDGQAFLTYSFEVCDAERPELAERMLKQIEKHLQESARVYQVPAAA